MRGDTVKLEGKTIGCILTGAYGAFSKTILQIQTLVNEGADVIPIMSEHAYITDTKFGKAKEHIQTIQMITQKHIWHTWEEVAMIGTHPIIDVMVIAPATGNTIAKLANGITDTLATFAVKSHLRHGNPLVIGICTHDGLSGSAENIGKLLQRKQYYFIPFRQDNPITKPYSLAFAPNYLLKTVEMAVKREQIQPILLGI